MATMKRYGDRRQPCRIPLELLNLPKDWPLMTTEKIGHLMQAATSSIKLSLNPSQHIANLMKLHSSLSKAFAKSSLSMKALLAQFFC
uniref:Uncharacterized protein n=1 Tax=Arundo donax TaxID=35708 RepID=A0A0A9BBZ9_ARUDO